jgi:hypothetical protein
MQAHIDTLKQKRIKNIDAQLGALFFIYFEI